MPDPILDEIWRVREQLIKQHGGIEQYFQYVQKLDRARTAVDHRGRILLSPMFSRFRKFAETGERASLRASQLTASNHLAWGAGKVIANSRVGRLAGGL